MRSGWALVLLTLLAGCAHSASHRMLARAGVIAVCKHCNCFMPADAPAHSICSVCDCGYAAAQCRR